MRGGNREGGAKTEFEKFTDRRCDLNARQIKPIRFVNRLLEVPRLMDYQKSTDSQTKDEAKVRKFLSKWQGGEACIWEYTVSHRNLTIRVVSKNLPGNLHIGCTLCEHIAGPVKWEGCSFDLERQSAESEEVGFVLRDEDSNFVVRCGGIEVFENVKPVY